MSEYKRLTDKEYVSLIKKHYNRDYTRRDRIYLRLAELEDKLESCKALELLADIGDTIYVPWVYDGNSGIAHLPIIEIRKDKKDVYYHAEYDPDVAEVDELYNYGICTQSTFGAFWFTDKALAQVRLEELIKEVTEE